MPVMVADRLAFWEMASTHQVVILLALIAALFVLLNAIRSGGVSVGGAARVARWSVICASASLLLFVAGFAVVMGDMDMDRFIFDFPPPGTGLVLAFPVLAALCTVLALGLLVPVWRASDCSLWQRVRYTYVSLIFGLVASTLFTLFVIPISYRLLRG